MAIYTADKDSGRADEAALRKDVETLATMDPEQKRKLISQISTLQIGYDHILIERSDKTYAILHGKKNGDKFTVQNITTADGTSEVTGWPVISLAKGPLKLAAAQDTSTPAVAADTSADKAKELGKAYQKGDFNNLPVEGTTATLGNGKPRGEDLAPTV